LKSDAALLVFWLIELFCQVSLFNKELQMVFYTAIHKDLDFSYFQVLTLFNLIIGATAKPYASANFARGLEARAYGYKGDFANVEIWANSRYLIFRSSFSYSNYSSVYFSLMQSLQIQKLF
jgi:hypothetical protein